MQNYSVNILKLYCVWLEIHWTAVPPSSTPPPPFSLCLSVSLPLSLTSQVCIYSQQMGSPMTSCFRGPLAQLRPHCRTLKRTRSNSLFTLPLQIWPTISLWLHPLFMCSPQPHTQTRWHARATQHHCGWTCPPCSGVYQGKKKKTASVDVYTHSLNINQQLLCNFKTFSKTYPTNSNSWSVVWC